MFLKRLEISGFKSFAAKTTLDFSSCLDAGNKRGVTVIVGPNGSGKSNVADAMRWVMGEQSMKNLRGKKSEDIIFAGSGKKSKLGSAKVTLFLDNSSKIVPLDFGEIAITRKIFRSGESEYLINDSRVRLQDVVDILAKAGVGRESYAIVNQGMADSVLNASPTERRAILEDAAGVKQYQIKKDRSLRKLDSTRDNLDKVKGLIEEIKPHLRMLKRQAEKATQGEEISRLLKEKQNLLFSWLWSNFQNEREKSNSEKDDIGRLMMNVQREADKLLDELNSEEKHKEENKKLAELDKLSRDVRTRYNALERELIIAEGRLEIEKERQVATREKKEIKTEDIPVNFGYVKAEIEEIKKDQEKLIVRLEKVENMEELQEIRELARVIQQRLFELKADMEKGKKSANNAMSNSIASKKHENDKKEEISQIVLNYEKKTAELRSEIKKTENEIREIDENIEKEMARDRERRQRFFEIERQLRSRQDELNKFKDKFNEAKISLAKLEVREEDLINQVKEELKISVSELKPLSEEEVFDRGEIEREIGKLKIKMEQIGGIDPLVVSEYEETQKRFEFLASESEDLEKAIVTLREVVREMDQKISEAFNETFSEINKEFSKYFKIIFGGGHASLNKKKEERKKKKEEGEISEENGEENGEELEEKKEEREEFGIEISACPPGKRIAHPSMLSGGERSLTSLALLFAIISHNPPPFAVLDEVEAALDEANSKRFGRILSELSQSTQFVIITHNRETMRQASLLYGVTMGEDGVSKLLSVKLDQVGRSGKILKNTPDIDK